MPDYTWVYDESHARLTESHQDASGTRKTWYLHPDNAGGLAFETEIAPSGAISNRHYLMVDGRVVGVLVSTSTALPSVGSNPMAPPALSCAPNCISLVKVEYWHKDDLGSLITTTDHTGAVTQRYAYDPFGKRRYTGGSYDTFGNVDYDWSPTLASGTDRGFTGQEQLDDVGLVHMNGRIFDPTLGVFLQADPHVTDPGNLQNFNRYGYCLNNPMSCMDPTGFDGDPPQQVIITGCASCVLDFGGQVGSGGFGDGGIGGPITRNVQSPWAKVAKGGQSFLRQGLHAARVVIDNPATKGFVILGATRAGQAGGIALGTAASGVCDVASEGLCAPANPELVAGGALLSGKLASTIAESAFGALQHAVDAADDANDSESEPNSTEPTQPNEQDLRPVKEKDGNKIAQDAGYDDAHDAKEGRGNSSVNIYKDKTTGKYWLWSGVKGWGKEQL